MGVEKLNRFINNENLVEYKDYTMINIVNLLNDFGNPHQSLKFIHIAGTNGKGSTAYMLNSILINSGYKTGLFISPHLVRINERIQINNREIDDFELSRYIDEIIDHIEKNNTINPTYFDIITLIGLRYFFDNRVDIAIIETGLGGRLDSTNVITPLCSVITDISMDHINILGENLVSIVTEKSGIIKKNIPVVTSNTDETVKNILKKKSLEMNSEIFFYNEDYFSEDPEQTQNGYLYKFIFNIHQTKKIINDIKINLNGYFQIKNSSMVIAALLIIITEFNKISDASIKQGLLSVTVPGRFQIMSKEPFIIFDPAHNVEAIKGILETIRKKFPEKKIYYIVSLMRDKEYDKILSLILDTGSNIVYYELNDSRCYKPSEQKEMYNLKTTMKNMNDIKKFIYDNKGSDTLFIFTGSFRLYETAIECTKV